MSQSRFAAAALALSTLGAVPLPVPAADLAFDRALELSAEQAPQLVEQATDLLIGPP